jgi:dihydroorotate dehydrogenase
LFKLLDLALPIARRLDPEDAHRLALRALSALPIPRASRDHARLRVSAFGLEFPNPVGLAAGFDKNA